MFQVVKGAEGPSPFTVETAGNGPLFEAPIRYVAWREGVMGVNMPDDMKIQWGYNLVLRMLDVRLEDVGAVMDLTKSGSGTQTQKVLRDLWGVDLGRTISLGFMHELFEVEQPGIASRFTPRQTIALEHAAAGIPYGESHERMRITRNTLQRFRRQVITELGVRTMTGAVTASYLSESLNPAAILERYPLKLEVVETEEAA